MLDELTHMDRITQLQDAIDSLLTIMSRSIDYLHNHTDFRQVSDHIPISKARNPEKVHKGEVLESNRTELVTDLVRKAKQIQYLIDALPVPEPEEQQATRLAQMENELQQANAEYDVATKRARSLTSQVTILLRTLLARDPIDNTPALGLDTSLEDILMADISDGNGMDQDLPSGTPPPRTPPSGTPPNRTGREAEAGWKPPTPHVQTPPTPSEGKVESPWVKGTDDIVPDT